MKHSLLVRKTTCLENDILQIEFSVTVAGEAIPCVIWKPNTPIASRNLIAMGHGGAQHKMARNIRDRAIRYATSFRWTTLAIDAPGHGERITQQEAEAERLKTERRLWGDADAPSLSAGEKIAFLDALATQAVPEWQAALDTTLACFAPTVDSLITEAPKDYIFVEHWHCLWHTTYTLFARKIGLRLRVRRSPSRT